MEASFESTEGILRVLDDNGNPVWSCPVTLAPDGTAWLRGLHGYMDMSVARAVNRRLAALNMKFGAWYRWDAESKQFILQRFRVRGGSQNPFAYLEER